MDFTRITKDPRTRIITAVVLWYALFHFTLTHFCRDDFFYKSIFPSFKGINDFFVFFIDRYQTWSSRTLADILSVVFTASPIWIWKILNICAYTLVIITLSGIINQLYKNKDIHLQNLKLTALVFIVLFPIYDMKSAGWVTTSINYLWSMLAFLSICTCVFQGITTGNYTKKQIAVFLISVIYACTFELLAVMSVLILLFTLFIKIKDRTNCRIELIGLSISVFFVFYHILCPGNTIRGIQSIDLFSSWNSMNMIEHINIALSATFARLSSFSQATGVQVFLLYSIFNLLILVSLHKKYKDIFIDLFFLLPFCFIYLFNQTDFKFESIDEFSESVSSFYIGQFRYTYQPILSILLFGLNITGLFLLFKDRVFRGINCGYLICLLYVVSVGTRLALGLSPSVYISDYRTFIILIFTQIFISLVLLNEINFVKWFKKQYE